MIPYYFSSFHIFMPMRACIHFPIISASSSSSSLFKKQSVAIWAQVGGAHHERAGGLWGMSGRYLLCMLVLVAPSRAGSPIHRCAWHHLAHCVMAALVSRLCRLFSLRCERQVFGIPRHSTHHPRPAQAAWFEEASRVDETRGRRPGHAGKGRPPKPRGSRR